MIARQEPRTGAGTGFALIQIASKSVQREGLAAATLVPTLRPATIVEMFTLLLTPCAN